MKCKNCTIVTFNVTQNTNLLFSYAVLEQTCKLKFTSGQVPSVTLLCTCLIFFFEISFLSPILSLFLNCVNLYLHFISRSSLATLFTVFYVYLCLVPFYKFPFFFQISLLILLEYNASFILTLYTYILYHFLFLFSFFLTSNSLSFFCPVFSYVYLCFFVVHFHSLQACLNLHLRVILNFSFFVCILYFFLYLLT